MSVTIHVFKKRGCVLAINISRALVDAYSFNLFLRAWSNVHNNLPPCEDEIIFDKPQIVRSPTQWEAVIQKLGYTRDVLSSYILRLMSHTTEYQQTNMDRVVLTFSENQVQRLKQSTENRMHEIDHPAKNQALGPRKGC